MAWLYAVDNVTQPQAVRLVLVQDPGPLPWIEISPATRAQGSFRGVRREAVFTVTSEAVATDGQLIDMCELPLHLGRPQQGLPSSAQNEVIPSWGLGTRAAGIAAIRVVATPPVT